MTVWQGLPGSDTCWATVRAPATSFWGGNITRSVISSSIQAPFDNLSLAVVAKETFVSFVKVGWRLSGGATSAGIDNRGAPMTPSAGLG